MNREDYLKLNKENLIYRLLESDMTISKLKNTVKELEIEIANRKLNDFLYDDYLSTKELLKQEQESNRLNCSTIHELNELLDRYKNIVDRLGGKNENI